MAKSNQSNRPLCSLAVGSVAATIEKMLMVAHKKMRIREISLCDISAVVASGANYIQAQVLVDGVLVGAVVDTQAGLAARGILDLNIGTLGYLDVESGSVVSVALTKVGTGALTEASLHSDVEIIGN